MGLTAHSQEVYTTVYKDKQHERLRQLYGWEQDATVGTQNVFVQQEETEMCRPSVFMSVYVNEKIFWIGKNRTNDHLMLCLYTTHTETSGKVLVFSFISFANCLIKLGFSQTLYGGLESCTHVVHLASVKRFLGYLEKTRIQMFTKAGTENFMPIPLSRRPQNSEHVGQQRQYLQSLRNSMERMGCLLSYLVSRTKALRDLEIPRGRWRVKMKHGVRSEH